MIRRHLKKACIGVCGMLMVQMIAVTPVNAEVLPTPTPAQVETDAVVIPEGTTFKTAIPDDNFRNYIIENFFEKNVKDDDKFTAEMAEKLGDITGVLDISGKKIVNLKGIEHFTGITELDASYNNLQLLDITQLTKLMEKKSL